MPLFGKASSCPVLWLFDEARLDKMLVKRKGPLNTQLLHDNEGDTICEGVPFILMALEIGPPCIKECGIDMDELHRWTL
jgi:hypothetical protein